MQQFQGKIQNYPKTTVNVAVIYSLSATTKKTH